MFFFVLSTSNRRRGRYIACPAGVGNFFFFFPLFFFPFSFLWFVTTVTFCRIYALCTHAGGKLNYVGCYLLLFYPPPLAHRFPYWAPHPRRWAAGFGCASMPRAGLLTVLYLTSRCHFPPTYVRPVLNYVVLLLLLLFIIVPFPLFSLFHILCV